MSAWTIFSSFCRVRYFIGGCTYIWRSGESSGWNADGWLLFSISMSFSNTGFWLVSIACRVNYWDLFCSSWCIRNVPIVFFKDLIDPQIWTCADYGSWVCSWIRNSPTCTFWYRTCCSSQLVLLSLALISFTSFQGVVIRWFVQLLIFCVLSLHWWERL